jgi:predicted phage terminase large subunit-like protein
MGRKRKPELPSGMPTDAENAAPKVELDADLIEGFAREYLWDTFDDPAATPEFHRDVWRLWCLPHPQVADAAPRGHAKTTGCTVTYTLAALLFGANDYVLLVSSTESMAAGILALIHYQLTENERLIADFEVHGMSKDNDTTFEAHIGTRVVKVIVKGAEQKLRGLNWRNKRPNLIIVDDMEDDEAVENPERRQKLRHWFDNALSPVGSRKSKMRVHGTVMHEDSLLNRLLKDSEWKSKIYSAHRDFDDFSNILWPEAFSEEKLRSKRQHYINQGNPHGYAREYLNRAIIAKEAFFRPDDFVEIPEDELSQSRAYYGAVDIAVSESAQADNTSFLIGGMTDDRDGDGSYLDIMDNEVGRFDPVTMINTWFAMHERWKPRFWVVETGVIEKVIGPFLRQEMRKRNVYFDLVTKVPTKNKQSRAKSIQGRMRAKSVRFDKFADWYPPLEVECQTFPRGVHDDRVDSLSLLGLALEDLTEYDALEEDEELEAEAREVIERVRGGRSKITGY